MTNAAKLLRRMRCNPRDWRIDDLRRVAERNGLNVAQGKGSHVNFKHPSSPTVLTVPATRPVKPIYVRQLIRFIGEVTETP